MTNLSNLERPSAGCNGEVAIKIEAYSDCNDNITGEFFGSGFKKILNLRGYIRALPRDIERTISFNGKTQRVRRITQYQIQGSDAFPEWKMQEIEDMFSLKTIIVDGQPIVFKGGKMFEKINSKCPFVYKLSFIVEEKLKQQIHGCGDECSQQQKVYLIPERQINDRYYNSSGQKIADSFQQLLNWFSYQNGITEVSEIAAVVDCYYYKVFVVKGTGLIPSNFYFDSPLPQNQVYGMNIDPNSSDINLICNGINNTLCGTIILDTPTIYELVCNDITVGIPIVYVIGENCEIEPMNGWEELGTNDISSIGTSKTLNLSLFNENYVMPSPPSQGTIFSYTSNIQSNCNIQTEIPDGAIFNWVRVNGITVNPGQYSYNSITKVITLNTCLNTNDTLEINYAFASAPVISEFVAMITGTNCQPKQLYVFNHNTNPDIPPGASLILYTDGRVKWNGAVTSADNTGAIIEATNIYYESN